MARNSELKKQLFSLSNNVPVRIRRWKTDILDVYITRCTFDGVVWARNANEAQDVRIFPSRHVEILKIGGKNVKNEYSDEMEAYLEYMKEKRKKEFMEIYRGAVRHQYELGDGEPIK